MGQRLRHQDRVRPVAFSPDGKLVVTGSTGGYIRVWSLPVDDPLVEACRRVSRNLSMTEWQQYLGAEPYRKTCPEWP